MQVVVNLRMNNTGNRWCWAVLSEHFNCIINVGELNKVKLSVLSGYLKKNFTYCYAC